MRYRLRTLLIVLALGPPVLAALVYVCAMLLGAGAPGGLFGPEGLSYTRPDGTVVVIGQPDGTTPDENRSPPPNP